ncbi:MAG: helicase C-terminal domain-containing protein [Candidatus Wallbacteria bacterium]
MNLSKNNSNTQISDIKFITEYFKTGGIISRAFEGYEERRGQAEMACAIYHSLSEERHSLIEAPCGIGKSYAYLIPAALYAKASGEKVVISTNTKTLQEQLKNNDLPTITQKFGLDFKYKILKGKNNYICLRKLFDIKNNGIPLDLFSDYAGGRVKMKTDLYLDAVAKIIADNTAEFEELDHETSNDIQLQKMIACQSLDCVGGRCEYFKECNYFSAVQQAQKSDVIIVNHSLYFSCLMVEANEDNEIMQRREKAVKYDPDFSGDQILEEKTFANPIPPHTKVIFDEAHHIPDVAQKSFSLAISFAKFNANINMILYALKKNISKKYKKLQERLNEQKFIIDEQLKLYFNYFSSNLSNEFGAKRAEETAMPAANNGDESQSSIALLKQLLFNRNHLSMISANPNVNTLNGAFEKMNAIIEEIGEILAENKVPLNVSGMNRIFLEMTDLIEFWHEVNKLGDGYILWGTMPWQSLNDSRAATDVELIASPLEVAPILARELFGKRKSVVMTSATLSTDNNFKYIKGETGLSNFDPIEIMLDSPYDIERQTGFIIPPVEATPKDRNFSVAVAKWVQDIICHSNGRTLVLFTSKYLMDYTYRELSLKMKLDGYSILVQGQEPKGSLLKKFKNDVHSSLFALDSFWEGIDVKGESLSTLVITKLPFKVPTHPLNEARDAYMKRQNRDPFSESSIPWTILKLKQGIGRLIRQKSDKGVLVILDTRLRDTAYGRKIVNALPKYNYIKSIDKIQEFLKK